MSMADLVAIGVETLRIDSWCSLEKEFSELICMNPYMVLYLTVNQVDLCHGCVYVHLTWDAKDIDAGCGCENPRAWSMELMLTEDRQVKPNLRVGES